MKSNTLVDYIYLSSQYPTQPDHKEDVKHCRSNDRTYSHVALCNKYPWGINKKFWKQLEWVFYCIFVVHNFYQIKKKTTDYNSLWLDTFSF